MLGRGQRLVPPRPPRARLGGGRPGDGAERTAPGGGGRPSGGSERRHGPTSDRCPSALRPEQLGLVCTTCLRRTRTFKPAGPSKESRALKLAQLQVMLGTSYTAPYKSVLPGDQGKTDSDNLFKEIMQDPHVDVLAPQFYGDGTNAHIIPTDQSSIQLMDWGTLSGDKPVQPTLLLASMDTTTYSTQKKQFEAACNSTPPLVPKKFCESGYWVYQNPK